MLIWWSHWRDKDTYTRTSLTYRTPTHTQHKEISPFSATQSLRPWPPFRCFSGVVEKKTSPLSISVWFPNTLGLSSIFQPSFPIQHSMKTNHCIHATKPSNSQLCEKQKKIGWQPKIMNAPQDKQSDSKLFLALAWPKPLSGNPKHKNVPTAKPKTVD